LRAVLITSVIFLGTVAFAIASFWLGIKLAKARIGRWDSSSSVRFVISAGNLGERQIAMWRRTAGYGADEADTIIGYQFLSLLGIVLGFLVNVAIGVWMMS
jgi:hypothetical protein